METSKLDIADYLDSNEIIAEYFNAVYRLIISSTILYFQRSIDFAKRIFGFPKCEHFLSCLKSFHGHLPV